MLSLYKVQQHVAFTTQGRCSLWDKRLSSFHQICHALWSVCLQQLLHINFTHGDRHLLTTASSPSHSSLMAFASIAFTWAAASSVSTMLRVACASLVSASIALSNMFVSSAVLIRIGCNATSDSFMTVTCDSAKYSFSNPICIVRSFSFTLKEMVNGHYTVHWNLSRKCESYLISGSDAINFFPLLLEKVFVCGKELQIWCGCNIYEPLSFLQKCNCQSCGMLVKQHAHVPNWLLKTLININL